MLPYADTPASAHAPSVTYVHNVLQRVCARVANRESSLEQRHQPNRLNRSLVEDLVVVRLPLLRRCVARHCA